LGGKLDSEARTAIHLTHRLGAVLVTLSVLGLAWQLRAAGLKALAGLLVAALVLQIGLGLSNVLFHLPLPVAVAHNSGAALLLLGMTLVNYRLRIVSDAVGARLARERDVRVTPIRGQVGSPHRSLQRLTAPDGSLREHIY
jgi:cytochrome c oxidase assembly protein subunit 15